MPQIPPFSGTVYGCQRCGSRDWKRWKRTSGAGLVFFILGCIPFAITVGTCVLLGTGLAWGDATAAMIVLALPSLAGLAMTALLWLISACLTERGWRCNICGYQWRE